MLGSLRYVGRRSQTERKRKPAHSGRDDRLAGLAARGQFEMAVLLRGDGGACFQYGAQETVSAGRGVLTGAASTQKIPAHLIGKAKSVFILTGADLL